MFKKLYIRSLLFSMLMGLGSIAVAQAEAGGVTEQELLRVIMFTMIVMSIVALLLTFTIMTLARARVAEAVSKQAAETTPDEQPVAATPSAMPWSWSWLKDKLTDAVPVAKEADIDLGHDYDGIRELDNNLPPWWKYGFYFTIAWGVVYLCVFHVFGDWSQEAQYDEEMAIAEAEVAEYLKTAGDRVDENTATFLTDEAALASGKAIYDANCMPCHGMSGEGGIGPAFADQYWIHGGDMGSIFKVIKYGIPTKGMIAWQDQLRPAEIQEVASYLVTFVGTTPPNLKEPQGKLYDPEGSGEEAAPAAEEEAAETDEAISMN